MNRTADQVTNATYLDQRRATEIYGEAFRCAFEYVYGSHIPGSVVEFGCFEGFSTLLLADLMVEFDAETEFYAKIFDRGLHVYDSFEGFPKSTDVVDAISYEVSDSGYWAEHEDASPPGTEELLRAELARRFGDSGWSVVRGMFEDTLVSHPLTEPVAIANLDCDLYASSVQVLDHLLGNRLLPDGAVLLLDDYNCNRANPRFGMRRAMRECFARTDGFYDYSEFLRYGWHGRAFFVHRLGDSPNPDER
ncbi:Macrocin-O-methyltransferase (TylF) [Saccharopolyspora antimicrobica]|uniref:Macrocin-O-methyltransferase (TylF) n=1 Tax=Saccharopolyspora antimicrobica TaxID=455193 RepID=A0A1I4WV79_9PSEU|nr:TylF/MycF/NovP-related O-methyltransferase [Saccharopolyspora antimicrobica]RKT82961.1 macrocin-O-methyltransferase TylF [Saccharopolyspora antimicrobica]SFN17076.1 Macrocin-O-methyltransferase (TylF) [Saccharopolyspora antimicrobica]